MSDDASAIAALVHEYAYRLDAGDIDGVVAMFEHAEMGSLDRPERGRGLDAARANYEPVIIYDDGTPQTMHVISNVTIDVDGDHAASRSYFTVFQCVHGHAYEPIVGGAYHDRFERVDGDWRFSQRLFEPKLIGDLSRHLSFDFGLGGGGDR